MYLPAFEAPLLKKVILAFDIGEYIFRTLCPYMKNSQIKVWKEFYHKYAFRLDDEQLKSSLVSRGDDTLNPPRHLTFFVFYLGRIDIRSTCGISYIGV